MTFRELLEGKTPKVGDIIRAHNKNWKVLRDITSPGQKRQFECHNTENPKEMADIYVQSMK